MEALGHQHNTSEWRLFIDPSKVSLKAVLLHNGNKYLSVPIIAVEIDLIVIISKASIKSNL
jgi:hypothetical protein